MIRGHTGAPAKVCAVTITVQYLLCSGDRGATTTFQLRRHHFREPGISRRRKWGQTGRDAAGSGADGSMGNAVCRRCWGRVQTARRARENDDGNHEGIRCVWLDRIREEDGDSPDAGTGEGATTGGDTNTTFTGAGDCSSRPEVPPGPPARIPGRPHYRERRHHARHQPPDQNGVGMF